MTKNLVAVLFLVLFASPSALGQSPADWVKFSPPGSPFTILLPTQPKEDKEVTQHSSGPYTSVLFTSRGLNREIFFVGWVDYSPKFNFGVQAELEANRDNFIKNAKATLISTTPIKLGVHPGLEFKAEIAGKVDIISRVYIVRRRPYQLIAVTPQGRDSSAARERFFSSFKLSIAN